MDYVLEETGSLGDYQGEGCELVADHFHQELSGSC